MRLFRGFYALAAIALCAAPIAAAAAPVNTEFIAAPDTVAVASTEVNQTAAIRDRSAPTAQFAPARANLGAAYSIDRRAPRYIDPG